LRELGYDTDYMVFNFQPESWLARECDFDLELDGQKGLRIEKTRELEFFHYAIRNYDIFHFHSGYGLLHPVYELWERLDELKYLKSLGKKIVMSWWGCDLRTEDIDLKYEFSACNECNEKNRLFCKNDEKKRMMEKAFKYADVHLSVGDLVASYEAIKWIDNPIDCNEWSPMVYESIPEQFRLPETEKVRIYHSFGNSEIRGDVKGTRYIREVVKKLKAEGCDLEFIFFDKVPNKYLKYYQSQADIVIDQLRSGWHGSTAVECLSLGKPVITYIRPEVAEIIPHQHPLINANIHTIYDVLKDLVRDRERVKEIGKKSRKYALKHHSYNVVARRLEQIYGQI